MKSFVELSNAFLENSSKRLDADYDNRIAKLKELGYNEEQIANMRDAELERINERAKENFEIAKKLQYAQTLLSTIQGTQEAFTTANKSPITPFFPAYPFLQAAAAAAVQAAAAVNLWALIVGCQAVGLVDTRLMWVARNAR
jgi:hypothetical protein